MKRSYYGSPVGRRPILRGSCGGFHIVATCAYDGESDECAEPIHVNVTSLQIEELIRAFNRHGWGYIDDMAWCPQCYAGIAYEGWLEYVRLEELARRP